MSCSRLWVIRFATSPSQNTGIEIPINAKIMMIGSSTDPRETAASTPRRMLKKTQMMAAPKTSENVTGAACQICGITFVWLPYEIRSCDQNMCFIISAY